MRLIFKELFLFAPSEKLAKRIEFIDGINIITSSQEDGTDRGKSVVMRSLYHVMGAEGYFEKTWTNTDKVYILRLELDGKDYFIYRTENLYKFFDEHRQMLFSSVNSRDLSERLKEYTHFAVQLPNRNDNEMEITPPAFNYLPFFIDQDHYAGNDYTSFRKLSQYAGFKENVLFYHLGAFDEHYFELINSKDSLKRKKDDLEKELSLIEVMLDNLDKKLSGISFSSTMESLHKDVTTYHKEYAAVLDKLNVSKKKIIELRNGLYETERMLKEIDQVTSNGERKIKKLREHICPECGRSITDTIHIKSKHYSLIDDAIAIKNELQIALLEDQKNIEDEENVYKNLLEQMKEYEEKLKISDAETSDVLKRKGLAELRDDIISSKRDISDSLATIEEDIDKLSKEIKVYSEKKKRIEEAYYTSMLSAKIHFGMNELSDDCFKKLTTTVNGSGSNKNVATVMWYMAILNLRRKFNSNAIEFPIVFDSINNVETDNEKKYNLVQYVAEKSGEGQLVLALLGFDRDDIKTDRPVNVIELTNEKYKLLDANTYEKYKELLEYMCDAQ